MKYRAEIPYGAYWSTPFARWQGSFSNLHSIEFAAHVARHELGRRNIDPAILDYGVLGFSVPHKHAFYGLPWLTGLIGAPRAGGPTMMQACATGVRTLLAAVQEVDAGLASVALAINCDRTSNGPHLYYPNPRAPGGTGSAENWVMDNFGCDPLGGHSMLQTAENVAARHGVATAQQHEVVLRREQQYAQALENGAAFLKRFMSLPFDVPSADFRKTVATLDGDEGVVRSSAESLARLKPVAAGGTITYGGQTHPADGNAAIIVTTAARARELSRDPAIAVRLHGFGLARAELAYMPEATIPAARNALAQAGRGIADIDAVKTHNPFAVNDLVFARETGADLMHMNNYGCSLVWGHPQAPMGTRAIIELIEELALRGGGFGLFAGCAAGDTAMAVVLEVGDAHA
ncbi:thiolase family protein [Thauera aromatica]|uniref:Thiolase IaaA n=1 Tax=Thauera aromatica K172 TaxID=44139 RepID=A0A2R4BQ17_THAAR|nr:thiolase family protein [Thauera aromatica]AVR89437.1 thiolase IaaA [Thauera aromatica K172]